MARRKSLESFDSAGGDTSAASVSSTERTSNSLDLDKDIREAATNAILFTKSPSLEFSPAIEDTVNAIRASLQHEILGCLLAWHVTPPEELDGLEDEILMKQLHLDLAPVPWIQDDVEGEVFGWPSAIKLKVTEISGNPTLVRVRPMLTLSELSTLKREIDFHNKKAPTHLHHAILVTDLSHISQDVKALADTFSIALESLSGFT